MKQRNITNDLLAALGDTPVVLLNGARQTGKSTLVQELAAHGYQARYLTFDDPVVLSAAETDPDGFVRQFEGPVVLDEVQRVPSLFRALKAAVDQDRQPGRFLLTGSADVLLLPGLSDSLAGRMEILTLWPFSQGELEGRKETFVDTLFGDTLPGTLDAETDDGLWERVLPGGYPEVIARTVWKRRRAWFNAYITTILQRDVRDLANIEGLTQMPRLLALLSARSGSLLNYSEVSRASGTPMTTLKRYMALLETTFLIQTVPAWQANLSKRLVKSPKLFVSDTGLLAHLIGLQSVDHLTDRTVLGGLLETFVVMELRKQIAWSEVQPSLYHFRTQTGQEVDGVLETASGQLVGIEVKAGVSVSRKDLRGLKALAEARPEAFHRGVIVYGGREVVRLGDRLHAVPMAALWRW